MSYGTSFGKENQPMRSDGARYEGKGKGKAKAQDDETASYSLSEILEEGPEESEVSTHLPSDAHAFFQAFICTRHGLEL